MNEATFANRNLHQKIQGTPVALTLGAVGIQDRGGVYLKATGV